MIPQWRTQKIVALLADRMPYRDIATMVGVSRDTVQRIANGSRPDYELLRKNNENEGRKEEHPKPPKRCPICGAMVVLPCHACRVRASMCRPRVWQSAEDRTSFSDGQMTLMLRPAEQYRYERIRTARRYSA
jgi:hypothetical protein